jgi:hypothetical protein
MESKLIEYPDVQACWLDKKQGSIHLVLLDVDSRHVHIVVEPFELLHVIDNAKIEEIKEFLINKIKEK